MLGELLAIPLAWIMLLLACLAYYQLLVVWLNRHVIGQKCSSLCALYRQHSLLAAVIIGTLPLIGLLGTVMGLQKSFTSLVYASSDNYAVTQGISFAMLTTLLGLALSILGWVLYWLIQSSLKKIEFTSAYEH